MTYVPAKKNTAYIIYVGLVSQADTKLLQVNPTIASGDFKVSIDGGAFANLATLPVVTPSGGRAVKISLSAGEMNGDNIFVQCVDASGAEWCDLCFNIPTAARQIDDLAYPTTSGRSMDVDTDGAVEANVTKIGNDAQSATDLKDFADAGYDPATNKVEGVKLADTLTTYTGNTPQTGDVYPKVDTEIATLIGLLDTEIADIQSRLPAALVGGKMDSVASASVLESIVLASGTAQAGASGSITLAAGASSVNDFYKGSLIKIYGGTGAPQVRLITAYNGTSKEATIDRSWATNPDSSSTYAVLAIATPALNASLQVVASAVAGAVNSVTNGVVVATNNDKTGYALSAAAVQAIWDALTADLDTAGSIGALLIAMLDEAISSRLAAVDYEAPDNPGIAAIQSKTDNLPADPAAVSDIPEPADIATGILDLANGIEAGVTLRQALRAQLAAAAGVTSGAGTSQFTVRDVNDSKDRIVADTDNDGNRTNVTLDLD